MNPQERAVIDGIFERLKNVANQPRDPEVERHIADLVRQQPYAPYAMAQSIYVQEQALLNQQREIEQLQAENEQLKRQAPAPAPQQGGGFLSGLFGGGQQAPTRAEPPAYGQRGQQPPAGPWGGQAAVAPPQAAGAGPWGGQQPAEPPKQGMGFLGTAAAAAAGVAGGMVLGSVLSSAFGGGGARANTGHSGDMLGGQNLGGQNFGGQNFLGQNAPSGSGYANDPQIAPEEYDDGADDAGDDGYDGYDDDTYEA